MRNLQRFSLFFGIFMLLTVMNPGSSVYANDNEQTRATLAGLKGIYVAVAPIDPDIEDEGLTARKTKKNTVRLLEKAGIKVMSDREYDKYKSIRSYPMARLEVIVDVRDVEDKDLQVYNIIVQIRQVVWLARKPVINLVGVTWRNQEFGHSNSLDLVQGKVKDLVKQFIDAYFSVNKK